jgi:hypothetical protein
MIITGMARYLPHNRPLLSPIRINAAMPKIGAAKKDPHIVKFKNHLSHPGKLITIERQKDRNIRTKNISMQITDATASLDIFGFSFCSLFVSFMAWSHPLSYCLFTIPL